MLRALGSSAGRLISRTSAPARPRSAALRLLSSKNGGGTGKGADDDDAASIFLSDESSLPSPPSYVRDAVTGKWTSDTLAEISAEERRLLRLDGEDRDVELAARAGRRFADSAPEDGVDDGLGALGAEHVRIAGRLQEEELALGPIGRDPAGSLAGDGEEEENKGEGDGRVDRPLSSREFQALKTYAQREHGVHPSDFARLASDDPDLIPHNPGGDDGGPGEVGGSAKQGFDADLDLAYLNPSLSRKAGDDHGAGSAGGDDDPFADLLPSDLVPSRKVNRRNARPLPRRLVHHNNLSLLRRYSTPGGKIMNRVQSRLGAKDQRKVARAIKRARHLGLIPHLGQWKLEDHGSLHGDGVGEKSDWEAELERRGLWPISDDSELFRRYYDVEGMMRHVGGPKGDGKREELEALLRGLGGMERRLMEGGGGAGEKTGDGDASSS